MATQYDATVKVNVTIEYPYDGDSIRQSDIKTDLRAMLEGLDIHYGGIHMWAVEVESTGRPTFIDIAR